MYKNVSKITQNIFLPSNLEGERTSPCLEKGSPPSTPPDISNFTIQTVEMQTSLSKAFSVVLDSKQNSIRRKSNPWKGFFSIKTVINAEIGSCFWAMLGKTFFSIHLFSRHSFIRFTLDSIKVLNTEEGAEFRVNLQVLGTWQHMATLCLMKAGITASPAREG